MKSVVENNQFVPSSGSFEGLLQRSNFAEKLLMADLDYAPTTLLLRFLYLKTHNF